MRIIVLTPRKIDKQRAKEQADLTCVECQKVFSNRRLLGSHMSGVHGYYHYVCYHCDRRFQTAKQRNVHAAVEHENFRYVCDLCDRSLKSEKGLRVHKYLLRQGFAMSI